MRKKVLGLAVIAMSLAGFAGMAQNPTDNGSVKQERVKGKKTDKDGVKRPRVNPFEGLNLTDAQKTKLSELDAKMLAERRQKSAADKAEKREQRKEFMAQRRAAKKAYLDEVKSILGPENYVLFLENRYMDGGIHGGKHAMSRGKWSKEKGPRHAHRKGERKGGKPRRAGIEAQSATPASNS